jgi:DNA repair exonuclease SbcCD nuclease subunit
MKTLILSDTHFGIKQNSITWLNSQIDFIYKEFIPCLIHLKKDDEVQVVHCGDVFDSRSTINTFVASYVRKAFKDIAAHCPVYIVAGNHDFYSPVEDDVSALDLTLYSIKNLNIVRDKIAILDEGQSLLVPWYEFDKKDVLEAYIRSNKPKNIFCHTDLTRLSPEYRALLRGINVYSGHIHTPQCEGNLFTLGSTYALTFADSNSDRGFYILDNQTNELKFVKAKNIIRFWRFYNSEIFDIDVTKLKNDYLELYINKTNLLNEQYTERISYITSKIHNAIVVPNPDTEQVQESVEFTNYNIEEICEANIPEKLKDKFKQISSKD